MAMPNPTFPFGGRGGRRLLIQCQKFFRRERISFARENPSLASANPIDNCLLLLDDPLWLRRCQMAAAIGPLLPGQGDRVIVAGGQALKGVAEFRRDWRISSESA
jgi:hypothetical protein